MLNTRWRMLIASFVFLSVAREFFLLLILLKWEKYPGKLISLCINEKLRVLQLRSAYGQFRPLKIWSLYLIYFIIIFLIYGLHVLSNILECARMFRRLKMHTEMSYSMIIVNLIKENFNPARIRKFLQIERLVTCDYYLFFFL